MFALNEIEKLFLSCTQIFAKLRVYTNKQYAILYHVLAYKTNSFSMFLNILISKLTLQNCIVQKQLGVCIYSIYMM